jgi:hypothetical protein
MYPAFNVSYLAVSLNRDVDLTRLIRVPSLPIQPQLAPVGF